MTFLHKNVGPQKGIFTAPKKQEQDAQQLQEKQKQLQKVLKLTSQGKPRKQVKSELHQEVSEFNPSGQMSRAANQSKVKPPGKCQETMDRKLEDVRIDSTWTSRYLVLKMTNQEREHVTLWQYQQGQNKQTNSQMLKIYDQNEQIENYTQKQKSLFTFLNMLTNFRD